MYAQRSAELLTEAGATEPFFWQRLRLVVATNWSGVRVQCMETLTGDHTGQRSGLTFSQHGERYRLWESDAVGTASQHGEDRLGGATIQSGCARGCLALVIQVVYWLIVDVCRARGRAWDSEDLRLTSFGALRGRD